MRRAPATRRWRAGLTAAWLLLLPGCAPMTARSPQIDAHAAAPAQTGEIAKVVAAIGLKPGESSYRLMQSNADALALRVFTAQQATSSLDLQYYMWLNDGSGRLLASEVLRAADRGVKVRVLVDDMYVRKLDSDLRALDDHPNLELRIYNPYRTRGSRIGNVLEFIFSGMRPNHRMHNKAWIADGRVALVGGRNIGDEYFGLHEGFNFRDLGVLLTGAAAEGASRSFDQYWNSPIVVPLTDLIDAAEPGPTLAQAQAALEEERALLLASEPLQAVMSGADLAAHLERGAGRLLGSAAHVSADPPDKWQQRSEHALGVAADLRQMIESAKHEVVLVSPYFVPGAKGSRWLAALQARGVQVRVLTNSLNATDVAAVHGGYARYRRRLLRAGVQINELKRSAGLRLESAFRGSSRASLHTKAVVVDGQIAFVGSFNLDPRSAWINTEMGALIDDPRFASTVRADYLLATAPEHSFRVTLEDHRLVWTDVHHGQVRRQYLEPTKSWSRRIIAFLARVLPLERQL